MERDLLEDPTATFGGKPMTFLNRVFSGARVVGAFGRASALLREVEEELKEQLLDVGPKPKALRFPHLELAPQAYWERNFFSILFVSIFQAIGIEEARVRDYAAIIHMVRGIVTATDNILDDEAKGALLVELRAGRVLPNVLSMLLQAGSLQERLRSVTGSDLEARHAWGVLIDQLYAIGEEESGEEAAIEEVLHPKRLLDEIHRFRGANLLLLAFVVPELNEPDHADAIAHAKAGVFRIGLALQILDDLADFEEDLRRRNHNLLRSWLVHGCGTDGRGGRAIAIADSQLAAYTPAELAAPHELFPQATGEVMVMAIELALRGFDRLRQTGHPLDRATARELMAAMFRLRGLPHLWERYLAFSTRVDDTTIEPYFEGL
jgi:hypothetical protein